MKKSLFIFIGLLFFVNAAYGQQTLRVSTPNGGEEWQDGNTHTIVWSASGVSGNIVVELIRVILNRPVLSNPKVLFSGSVNHDRKSFRWVINEKIKYGKKNTYRIRITSLNNASIQDMSDRDFTIIAKKLKRPPAGKIEITEPNASTKWNLYSMVGMYATFNYSIRWKKTGIFDPRARLRITLHGIGGPARKFQTILAPSTENDGWHNGEIPNRRCKNGWYRIKMRIVGQTKVIAESKAFKVIRKVKSPIHIPNPKEKK